MHPYFFTRCFLPSQKTVYLFQGRSSDLDFILLACLPIRQGRTVAFSGFRQSSQRRGRVGFSPTSLLSHTMWHPEIFLILPFSFSLCQVFEFSGPGPRIYVLLCFSDLIFKIVSTIKNKASNTRIEAILPSRKFFFK